MAKQPRFQVEDIERLFRALNPAGGPDPLGDIENLVLKFFESYEQDQVELEKYREKTDDTLNSIRTRTFGILILQIFKTLKLFFSLLPQGRVILLVVGVLGLAQTLLEGEKPSLLDIRAAVESTGIGKHLDAIMAEINQVTGELARSIQDLTDGIGEIFIMLGGHTEAVTTMIGSAMGDITALLQDLGSGLEVSTTEIQNRLDQVAWNLNDAVLRSDQAQTLADNTTDLLIPILRGLDEEIRNYPELAARLIRL